MSCLHSFLHLCFSELNIILYQNFLAIGFATFLITQLQFVALLDNFIAFSLLLFGIFAYFMMGLCLNTIYRQRLFFFALTYNKSLL